jgi:hypothetical protein
VCEGGIHVNISRTPYTTQYHEKVFTFLHCKKNYQTLLKLSGRYEQQFQENAAQYPKKTDLWGGHTWRYYTGIITTRKTYAYELRMFGAQPELLIPALEFAHALFDLAPQVVRIDWENLKQHIGRYQRYRNIHKRIKDLRL